MKVRNTIEGKSIRDICSSSKLHPGKDFVDNPTGLQLLLYTDGITEATDAQNVQYDTDAPLAKFFAHHKPDDAGTFIDDLIADIKTFTGNAPQSDDITALCLLRR